jgi:type VI secretion system protein VasD
MNRTLPLASLLVGVLWLAARLALAEPAPDAGATTVELTVVGGPALNPNAQGRASPVVVRIFDLAATSAFESADYAALFEKPGDALKRELLTTDEFVLRPGDIQERNRTLPAGATTIGVAAAFRDMAHAVWHLAVPLKPGQRNFILIHLDEDRIRLDTIDQG